MRENVAFLVTKKCGKYRKYDTIESEFQNGSERYGNEA